MADAPPATSALHLRNRTLAGACLVVFAAMVGLAFAAVPLYRAFCNATGFDGTPRRAAAAADGAVLNRTVMIRFDTNVRNLPWRFRPTATETSVKIGATSMAYFTVANDGDRPMTGRAAYNVSPESAAGYFLKLQCFCFSDQTIPAHTQKTFPVVFYVDPRFAKDPDTTPLKELTLSYTFYPAPDAARTAGSSR